MKQSEQLLHQTQLFESVMLPKLLTTERAVHCNGLATLNCLTFLFTDKVLSDRFFNGRINDVVLPADNVNMDTRNQAMVAYLLWTLRERMRSWQSRRSSGHDPKCSLQFDVTTKPCGAAWIAGKQECSSACNYVANFISYAHCRDQPCRNVCSQSTDSQLE